jgi:membrane-associated protease RseP (regulator of RpoE activity)
VVQNVEGTREASVPGLRKVDRAAIIDDLTRVTDQAIGARKQPNDFAQLVGVRADSLVAKLGLENGDRLLWVDGHPLTDASTRALWTDAAAKPTFWLLIHRDGKTIKVLYSFE